MLAILVIHLVLTGHGTCSPGRFLRDTGKAEILDDGPKGVRSSC